jgi:hypothetical protein
MNNEKHNQIIDEVWSNYRTAFVEGHVHHELDECLSLEEFIEEIKTDSDFSEKWGIQIEERVLSLGERNQIGNFDYTMCDDSLIYPTMEDGRKKYKELFDKENIPTKVITLIYNNETIEIYE